jgi:glycosyltransferase involved in cell wall biosynthesis/GT2 family glycosyltransferase
VGTVKTCADRAYSIVMSAFNAEATIGAAIESVRAQSLPDWSLVVVDDGSTDCTEAIATRYAATDPRIVVARQENHGVAQGRNTAVGLCATDYVAFLDADDELHPDYLRAMDAFIRGHPGHDIYHPNLKVVGPNGRESLFSTSTVVTSFGLIDLLTECVIAVGGAMVRRDRYQELGGFRSGIHCEDYDFWLRATAQGAKALYLPTPLYNYRQDRAGRRSEDALAGAEALVVSLAALLQECPLTPEMASRVEAALDVKRRQVVTVAQEQELARQADRLRDSLERYLGKRAAREVLAAAHRVTWLFRPIRRMLAESKARKSLATRRDRLSASTPPTDAVCRDERAMSILVVPSWFPSAGDPTAGVFIQQQVHALARRGDVAVLHLDPGKTSLPATVEGEGGAVVVRVSAGSAGRYGWLVTYRRTALAAFDALRDAWGTPDIVHVQALWPAGLIAQAIKHRYGIPYVVTEHSEEYLAASARRLVRTPGVVPILLRPLARGASRTIAVSRYLADRLVELRLAVDPVVVPNVVPVSTPAPMPVADVHAIAHISIMGPAKNLGALLQAVDRLRGRRTDFLLRLIGDGESRAGLEQMAAALKLGDVVQFTGRVPAEEIPALLAESAFTVVSSTHETFSVVAAESLMCGRPVLSTRCGGPEEFVTPKVGRLIEAGSVDALVEGLEWMLDHFSEFDPEALHRYAAERFAPDVVAAQILDVYRGIIDGR